MIFFLRPVNARILFLYWEAVGILFFKVIQLYPPPASSKVKRFVPKSPFFPHFELNAHANIFDTCQLTRKKRFKSCDCIRNTPVIKKERYLQQLKEVAEITA